MFFSSKRLVRDPYSLSTYEAEQPIRLVYHLQHQAHVKHCSHAKCPMYIPILQDETQRGQKQCMARNEELQRQLTTWVELHGFKTDIPGSGGHPEWLQG